MNHLIIQNYDDSIIGQKLIEIIFLLKSIFSKDKFNIFQKYTGVLIVINIRVIKHKMSSQYYQIKAPNFICRS